MSQPKDWGDNHDFHNDSYNDGFCNDEMLLIKSETIREFPRFTRIIACVIIYVINYFHLMLIADSKEIALIFWV